MIAVIENNKMAEILKICKFLSALSNDSVCFIAFASVEEPFNHSNVNINSLLVLIFALDGALQQFTTEKLRATFVQLLYCSLLASHLE